MQGSSTAFAYQKGLKQSAYNLITKEVTEEGQRALLASGLFQARLACRFLGEHIEDRPETHCEGHAPILAHVAGVLYELESLLLTTDILLTSATSPKDPCDGCEKPDGEDHDCSGCVLLECAEILK